MQTHYFLTTTLTACQLSWYEKPFSDRRSICPPTPPLYIPLLPHRYSLLSRKNWTLSRLPSGLSPLSMVKQCTPAVGGLLGALPPSLSSCCQRLIITQWRGCECRVKAEEEEEEDGEAEKEIKRERNRQEGHYIQHWSCRLLFFSPEQSQFDSMHPAEQRLLGCTTPSPPPPPASLERTSQSIVTIAAGLRATATPHYDVTTFLIVLTFFNGETEGKQFWTTDYYQQVQCCMADASKYYMYK